MTRNSWSGGGRTTTTSSLSEQTSAPGHTYIDNENAGHEIAEQKKYCIKIDYSTLQSSAFFRSNVRKQVRTQIGCGFDLKSPFPLVVRNLGDAKQHCNYAMCE